MARYGRDFGNWDRPYDLDYGRYTGQGNWGGGYYGGGMEGGQANRGSYGGRFGEYGTNRGYDFNQGYTPGRGYRGGGFGGGGMYGRGGTYRGWGGGTQGGWGRDYDRDFGDRVREGWNDFRQGVRRTFRGGYDRGW